MKKYPLLKNYREHDLVIVICSPICCLFFFKCKNKIYYKIHVQELIHDPLVISNFLPTQNLWRLLQNTLYNFYNN